MFTAGGKKEREYTCIIGVKGLNGKGMESIKIKGHERGRKQLRWKMGDGVPRKPQASKYMRYDARIAAKSKYYSTRTFTQGAIGVDSGLCDASTGGLLTALNWILE